MDDKEYLDWDKKVEKIQGQNNKLLGEFKKWLENKSLKPKTVYNHVINIETYANIFLARYEVLQLEKGALEIGEYLGDYFIRKMSWASKSSIIENIASFRKFYTFLNEIGKVSDEDLMEMKELIKDEKMYWIDSVKDFSASINDDW
jgi:site-specific recombinase XerD